MIRHFKWHKKRDESLQHGFMRYSPSDDCSNRYPGCTHNRKQTHYHCIQVKKNSFLLVSWQKRFFFQVLSWCQKKLKKKITFCKPHYLHTYLHTQQVKLELSLSFIFFIFFFMTICLLLYSILLQGNCDKVYISTSDVQMHANYHRKDSAIIQEGFQRLRATEECRTSYCAFFGQKTTHFHCRRDHCQYTFKNKADMGAYFSN